MFVQSPTIVQKAQTIIAESLQPGDFAVDATVGNGWDTLHLAQVVGPQGVVLGLDCQAEALLQARKNLPASLMDRIVLLERGHQYLGVTLDELLDQGRIRSAHPNAVMFNLGYLPGGDPSIATRAATTLSALRQAFEGLVIGGVITVVLYWSHDGGRAESVQVLDWAKQISSRLARIHHIQPVNTQDPPTLLVVEAIRGGQLLGRFDQVEIPANLS